MKPTSDNVLVEQIIEKERNGFLLPERHMAEGERDVSLGHGIVIAIGPKVRDVKVGDEVLFDRGRLRIQLNGKPYLLFHEVNILAKVEL